MPNCGSEYLNVEFSTATGRLPLRTNLPGTALEESISTADRFHSNRQQLRCADAGKTGIVEDRILLLQGDVAVSQAEDADKASSCIVQLRIEDLPPTTPVGGKLRLRTKCEPPD